MYATLIINSDSVTIKRRGSVANYPFTWVGKRKSEINAWIYKLTSMGYEVEVID